ncbi:hypothetical protein KUDE01_005890 [Dissostichus eleginoides]|uniref:Uncharacterized protein n=1 Tax=Dissostichus eleginoides TaxID=100907 RepID=A0AAD9FLB9_DISEL|nr:hypothetical protein KUDE01_005890 [Dissostichus eleginoides]
MEEVSEISGEISVTDGSKRRAVKTRGIPKTKDKLSMTGSESERKVQEESSVQKPDSLKEIKDIKKYAKGYKEALHKGKPVKVSPIEGTAEMRRSVSPEIEVKPQEKESETKKPEILSKSRTDVAQKVRRQAAVEDEEAVVKELQVSRQEKTKPRQEQTEKQVSGKPVEHFISEQATTVEEDTGSKDIADQIGFEMVTTGDPPTKTEKDKTREEITSVVEKTKKTKSLIKQEPIERKVPKKKKEPMRAKTEDTTDKEIHLKPITSKSEKGKEQMLLETSQTEEIPLKSEDVTVKIRENQTEKVTDTFTPEAFPHKQRQQKPIKGKAEDEQSKKRVRTKGEVPPIKVKDVTEQELIETTSPITPIIQLTDEEAPIEDIQDTVHEEDIRLDVSVGIKPSPMEKPPKAQIKVKANDKYTKLLPTEGLNKGEEIKKRVLCKSDEQYDADKPAGVTKDKVKSLKDKDVESTVTDTTAKTKDPISSVDADTSMKTSGTAEIGQEKPKKQTSVSDLTEESSKETPTGQTQKLVEHEESLQSGGNKGKDRSSKGTKPRLQQTQMTDMQPVETAPRKEITELAKNNRQILHKTDKAPDTTASDTLIKQKKPARKEQGGGKGVDTPVMDKTSDIETTDSEQKPQKIIVERDEVKLSTVSDKTFKVKQFKKTTTTQEQADRRASDTHLVEETSRELAVAPEKLGQIRETELATVEETDFFDEVPSEHQYP